MGGGYVPLLEESVKDKDILHANIIRNTKCALSTKMD